MADYTSHYQPESYAKQAATTADATAAAADHHALVPPPIALDEGYAVEQQERFRALSAEGRPGAAHLYEVYLEDERLQSTAGISYGHFAGAARLATRSVCRYDSLRGSLDQDGDLATNFTLGAGTAELARHVLADQQADEESGSLTGAMHGWKSARKALVTANKRVRSQLFVLREQEQQALLAADTAELAGIEAKIKKVEQIGAVLDVGVGAVTGGGHSLATGKSYVEKGANALDANLDVDVTSVAGAAKLGARLYYAEEIQGLKTKIEASKHALGALAGVATRGELEAVFDELDGKLADFERASVVADNALEDRRKQYAKAGSAVDADARSGGADEGEVGESLLLGSAAEEAALLVDSAREAGGDAESAVAEASQHARGRRATYHTADDMFTIHGNAHYTPQGRTDAIGDDPDLTALYQMAQAIAKWQAAADEATAHLGGATGAFRDGITEPAGAGEY